MNELRFSSEVELGKFLGSTDVIQDAYQAISELTSAYKLHTSGSGKLFLAFNCSPEYTARFLKGEFDLISSEKLQVIDFISTNVNTTFSINEAAVELFQHIGNDLKELEKKHIESSLIITGSGLGGYLAILSTLRLYQAIDVEESNGSKIIKRPICITFGSPIIGDITPHGAIAGNFINVVAKQDPVASFFSSNTRYKPFGTFLFCTESGGHTAFGDQDSILLVLDAMKSWNEGNVQIYDYAKVLSSIRRKVLYRGISELGEFNLNWLRAGIILQLKEVGVMNDVRNDDIEKMEMIKIKNLINAIEPSKKLNETKISLVIMEWYMKSRKSKGGYYDMYRNVARDEIDVYQVVRRHQLFLSDYWKKTVEELAQMPQKERAKLRDRWLYSGTTYRRIVEPLDIAEHYKLGEQNYTKYRSNHYKLLEKWLDEEKKNSNSSEENRTKPASLTEDSCFWAHVEEALILLRDLKYERLFDTEQKLEDFEAYVMTAIDNYSVSPDIFLEGSSFMKWWKEYKAVKGTAYASELAEYMNNESDKSYQ